MSTERSKQIDRGSKIAETMQSSLYTHSVLLGLPRLYSDSLLADAKRVLLKEGETLFIRGNAADGYGPAVSRAAR